jgi:hypothetical protein
MDGIYRAFETEDLVAVLKSYLATEIRQWEKLPLGIGIALLRPVRIVAQKVWKFRS